MKSPHVAPTPDVATERSNAPATIRAVDLTGAPETRALWRRWRSGSTEAAPTRTPGWPSPMGYWLTEYSERRDGTPPGERALHISAPGEADASGSPVPDVPSPGRLGRLSQTVRLKGADGELSLTI